MDLGLRKWKTDELAVLLEGDRKGVTKGLECNSVQRVPCCLAHMKSWVQSLTPITVISAPRW